MGSDRPALSRDFETVPHSSLDLPIPGYRSSELRARRVLREALQAHPDDERVERLLRRRLVRKRRPGLGSLEHRVERIELAPVPVELAAFESLVLPPAALALHGVGEEQRELRRANHLAEGHDVRL